jgi:hypothetical protein
MEARLLSEADERSQDKVRVMRLTNHTPNTMQLLASSNHLPYQNGNPHRADFFQRHLSNHQVDYGLWPYTKAPRLLRAIVSTLLLVEA